MALLETLLALGIGTTSGILAFLPSQLIGDPLLAQAWTAAWLVPWAAFLLYGVLALMRPFGSAALGGGTPPRPPSVSESPGGLLSAASR